MKCVTVGLGLGIGVVHDELKSGQRPLIKTVLHMYTSTNIFRYSPQSHLLSLTHVFKPCVLSLRHKDNTLTVPLIEQPVVDSDVELLVRCLVICGTRDFMVTVPLSTLLFLLM